jgi:uncharacterized membrane protein
MQVEFTSAMETISLVFEIAGVIVIIVGFVLALARGGMRLFADRDAAGAYKTVRGIFGKSVLLGLEILVAADLIRTIAVEPNMTNLTVLLMLVVIRTFLSWALDVELDGSWPWRKRQLAIEEEERAAAAATG